MCIYYRVGFSIIYLKGLSSLDGGFQCVWDFLLATFHIYTQYYMWAHMAYDEVALILLILKFEFTEPLEVDEAASWYFEATQ